MLPQDLLSDEEEFSAKTQLRKTISWAPEETKLLQDDSLDSFKLDSGSKISDQNQPIRHLERAIKSLSIDMSLSRKF